MDPCGTTQGEQYTRTDLVNNSIPRKASIVHNNMNLASTKLSCPLHQCFDITSVQDISHDSQRPTRLGSIDSIRDSIRLLYGIY